MTIVDLIMVGRLGPDAIGAVGLGNAIYYAPSLFGIGLLLGLDTLVSQSWGAAVSTTAIARSPRPSTSLLAFTPLLMLSMLAAQLHLHRPRRRPHRRRPHPLLRPASSTGAPFRCSSTVDSAAISREWAVFAPLPSPSSAPTSSTWPSTGSSSTATSASLPSACAAPRSPPSSPASTWPPCSSTRRGRTSHGRGHALFDTLARTGLDAHPRSAQTRPARRVAGRA